jgi:DNA-binding transcriptional LysR family regulator
MDLLRLRSFLVLADTLHFGRAAATLGIAQPHLSRRIRELEAEIGAVLFNRSQRRVELTQAGATLQLRAARIVKDIDKAADEARQIGAGAAGRLRIGFIHSSTYGVLPAILRRFRMLRPTVVLELVEMTILEQVTALRTCNIDIGVLRSLNDCPDIAFETVLSEPFHLAVATDHRLARRRRVHMRELTGQPLIMFPRATSPLFHLRITAAFERAGVTPMIVQEATQIHTVMGLVAAGLGIAIVPRSAHRLPQNDAVLVDLADPPEPADVGLAWMKAAPLPLLAPFQAAARQAAAAWSRTGAEGVP